MDVWYVNNVFVAMQSYGENKLKQTKDEISVLTFTTEFNIKELNK